METPLTTRPDRAIRPIVTEWATPTIGVFLNRSGDFSTCYVAGRLPKPSRSARLIRTRHLHKIVSPRRNTQSLWLPWPSPGGPVWAVRSLVYRGLHCQWARAKPGSSGPAAMSRSLTMQGSSKPLLRAGPASCSMELSLDRSGRNHYCPARYCLFLESNRVLSGWVVPARGQDASWDTVCPATGLSVLQVPRSLFVWQESWQ